MFIRADLQGHRLRVLQFGWLPLARRETLSCRRFYARAVSHNETPRNKRLFEGFYTCRVKTSIRGSTFRVNLYSTGIALFFGGFDLSETDRDVRYSPVNVDQP